MLCAEDGREPEGWERPAEDRWPVSMSISRTLQLCLPVLRSHSSGKLITSTVGGYANAKKLQQRDERGEQLWYSSLEIHSCNVFINVINMMTQHLKYRTIGLLLTSWTTLCHTCSRVSVFPPYFLTVSVFVLFFVVVFYVDVHSADSLSLSSQRDDHRVRVVVCVADLHVFKDVSLLSSDWLLQIIAEQLVTSLWISITPFVSVCINRRWNSRIFLWAQSGWMAGWTGLCWTQQSARRSRWDAFAWQLGSVRPVQELNVQLVSSMLTFVIELSH